MKTGVTKSADPCDALENAEASNADDLLIEWNVAELFKRRGSWSFEWNGCRLTAPADLTYKQAQRWARRQLANRSEFGLHIVDVVEVRRSKAGA